MAVSQTTLDARSATLASYEKPGEKLQIILHPIYMANGSNDLCFLKVAFLTCSSALA